MRKIGILLFAFLSTTPAHAEPEKDGFCYCHWNKDASGWDKWRLSVIRENGRHDNSVEGTRGSIRECYYAARGANCEYTGARDATDVHCKRDGHTPYNWFIHYKIDGMDQVHPRGGDGVPEEEFCKLVLGRYFNGRN